MKLKLFTIAIDHHYDGTTCRVFGTDHERRAAMAAIIQKDISGDVTQAANDVRDLLYGEGWTWKSTPGPEPRTGINYGPNRDLIAAWDLWRETIADENRDTYITGETEIDLPEPYASANELLDACLAVRDGWQKNLTDPLRQVDMAIAQTGLAARAS